MPKHVSLQHSTETVAAVETTNVFHRFRNKWNLVDAFHKGFNFLVICHHIIPVILHFKFLMFLIFQKFILRKSETIFYPKFVFLQKLSTQWELDENVFFVIFKF